MKAKEETINIKVLMKFWLQSEYQNNDTPSATQYFFNCNILTDTFQQQQGKVYFKHTQKKAECNFIVCFLPHL